MALTKCGRPSLALYLLLFYRLPTRGAGSPRGRAAAGRAWVVMINNDECLLNKKSDCAEIPQTLSSYFFGKSVAPCYFFRRKSELDFETSQFLFRIQKVEDIIFYEL